MMNSAKPPHSTWAYLNFARDKYELHLITDLLEGENIPVLQRSRPLSSFRTGASNGILRYDIHVPASKLSEARKLLQQMLNSPVKKQNQKTIINQAFCHKLAITLLFIPVLLVIIKIILDG